MADISSKSGNVSTNRKQTWHLHGKSFPILYLLPHLVVFTIFFLIPLIFGIYIAFTKWDLVRTPVFVVWDNFKTLLFSDSIFHDQLTSGLWHTILFVLISVPFCILVPLLLAVVLNTKPAFAKLFQGLFYLPSLFSISAVVIVWSLIFNPNYGPLNTLFHLDQVWTGTQPWAWMTIVILTVWWTIGGNMIIYQAALNGIPQDYYEAADIDGASRWKKFIHITLPSIRGQLLFTIVTTTIAQFNIYGQPLMMTNGGPNGSTTVLMMNVQQNAFGSGQSLAGISSAMAVILGICITIVSMVQLFLLRNKD